MGWNLFGGCGWSKHFVRRNRAAGEVAEGNVRYVRNVRNVRYVRNRAAGEVAEGNVGNAWRT
jgi:hypothetical protein